MPMTRKLAFALLAVSIGLAGCGKKDPDQPLAFAPADTVFLAGNLEPVPEAALDGWWKNAEQMLPLYESSIDRALDDLDDKEPGSAAAAILRAVREELRGKFNRAGWDSLGFSSSSRTAIYAIGLVPVLRMELGDADAFRALLARIEAKSGTKLDTREVAGQSYWRIIGGDSKAAVIMAVQGQHLVLTIAPAEPSEALLRQLLGLDRPAANALDAGTLAKFNQQSKFLAYGSGYIDIVRLATALTGERSPIEQEFLRALGVDAAATAVSPACRTEYAALAAAVPRLSYGYSTLDAKSMDLRYRIEVAPAHGDALAGLSAEVPGLDGSGEGLLDVGFALDLDAFAGFVNVRAAALAAAPFQCESLQELNQGIARINADLANPAVFMAGAAVNGFYLSLSQLSLPEGGTPVVQGKLAVGSDNPQSLMSMAGGFLPQIAAMNLTVGAAPVALPAGLLPPTMPPAHVVLARNALAISLGQGEEAGLAAFASAPAGDPSPLLHYGVDSRGMQVFLDALRKASEASLAAAEAAQADTANDAESSAEMAADLDELRDAVAILESVEDSFAESLDRVDFSVYATKQGLEARYVLELK
jgi:hypothetical protein